MKRLALRISTVVALLLLGGTAAQRNKRPLTIASVARLPSQR